VYLKGLSSKGKKGEGERRETERGGRESEGQQGREGCPQPVGKSGSGIGERREARRARLGWGI